MAAALGGREIPHGQQQSLIVFLAPPKTGPGKVRCCQMTAMVPHQSYMTQYPYLFTLINY